MIYRPPSPWSWPLNKVADLGLADRLPPTGASTQGPGLLETCLTPSQGACLWFLIGPFAQWVGLVFSTHSPRLQSALPPTVAHPASLPLTCRWASCTAGLIISPHSSVSTPLHRLPGRQRHFLLAVSCLNRQLPPLPWIPHPDIRTGPFFLCTEARGYRVFTFHSVVCASSEYSPDTQMAKRHVLL